MPLQEPSKEKLQLELGLKFLQLHHWFRTTLELFQVLLIHSFDFRLSVSGLFMSHFPMSEVMLWTSLRGLLHKMDVWQSLKYASALFEKCPYSQFLWSVFSRIRTEYVFGPNVGKYGPEKLHIRTLFTRCCLCTLVISKTRNTLFPYVFSSMGVQ